MKFTQTMCYSENYKLSCLKQIMEKKYPVEEILNGLQKISQTNGFSWDYTIIPLVRLYFQGEKKWNQK